MPIAIVGGVVLVILAIVFSIWFAVHLSDVRDENQMLHYQSVCAQQFPDNNRSYESCMFARHLDDMNVITSDSEVPSLVVNTSKRNSS